MRDVDCIHIKEALCSSSKVTRALFRGFSPIFHAAISEFDLKPEPAVRWSRFFTVRNSARNGKSFPIEICQSFPEKPFFFAAASVVGGVKF